MRINVPLRILLSALKWKMFYVFVLSHAEAEIVWKMEWSTGVDLVCVEVMKGEMVQNYRNYRG